MPEWLKGPDAIRLIRLPVGVRQRQVSAVIAGSNPALSQGVETGLAPERPLRRALGQRGVRIPSTPLSSAPRRKNFLMDKAEWNKWNCERKEKHAQQSKAEKILKKMKLKLGVRASNLVVYKCKVCKRWYHIGNE